MAEEIVFTTKVDTGTSGKNVDKLAKKINAINTNLDELGDTSEAQFKQIKKDIDSGKLSAEQYNKTIENLKTITLQAGRESPIGKQALSEAANLKDRIVDLDNEITRLSQDGKNLQGALQLGGAVAAGYGVAQSSMALFGAESEKLQKTLVKLQGATTLLTSIEQIRVALEKESAAILFIKSTATKTAAIAQGIYTAAINSSNIAMKALRFSMLALPIVAIIAGIAALTAALISFFSETEKAAEMNDKLTASIDRQNESFEKSNRAINRDIENRKKLAAAAGATEEEMTKLELEGLAARENQRKTELSNLQSQIERRRAVRQQAVQEENWELANQIRDQILKDKAKYNQLRELDGQYAIDRQVIELKTQKAITDEQRKAEEERIKQAKEARKKRIEEARKEAELRIELERTITDLMIGNMADSTDRAIMEMKVRHDREREALVEKFGEDEQLIKQLELKQKNERIKFIDEQAQAIDEKQAQLDQKEKDRKDKIQQETFARMEEIQQKQAQNAVDEIARQEEIRKATISAAEQTLGALGALNDIAFAIKSKRLKEGSKEEQKLAKRNFEINKKLQIAQAVMQGVQAVQAAFASGAAVPVVGAILGPLYAGAAGIVAASNIAKIRSQTFQGGGSGSSASVSAPRIPTATGLSPDVDNSGQQSGAALNQGTSTAALTGQANKVFVVDSDIKASLDNTKKIETISSI